MNPVIDTMTARALVALQDRPVVALSSWLAAALREGEQSGRTLQLVTPPETRMSLPLRSAGPVLQWVVHDRDGYYEALTGRPLRWDEAAFVPVPEARDYAPGFVSRPAGAVGAQLTLTYRARHAGHSVLGGQLERLVTLLTGNAPAGWGDTEPAGHLWDRSALTSYVRERADGITRLVAVGAGGGRTAIAKLEFADGGATEVTTLTIGHPPPDPPPVPHLPALVGMLADAHPVASLFAQLCPGRADVTFEPRWMGSPAPVGMAVAGERAGPAQLPGRPAGTPESPMTWFDLGDGHSPDDWPRHQELLSHLQAP